MGHFNIFYLRARKPLKILGIIVVTLCTLLLVVPSYEQVMLAANQKNRKLPIYCVSSPEKKVSVTFDAAWGADDTDTLIAILKEYDVKATFFLCGFWVRDNPEEAKKLLDAGHEIGSHGDSHASGIKLDYEGNRRELKGAHDTGQSVLGIEMNLFRPPYGDYNNTVVEAATSMGYYTIQWDVDSHDWMNRGSDYVINRVLKNKNLKNGSIILFHNDARDTPKALPVILSGLKEMGYEMVKVSDLIYYDNYYIDHKGMQHPKIPLAPEVK